MKRGESGKLYAGKCYGGKMMLNQKLEGYRKSQLSDLRRTGPCPECYAFQESTKTCFSKRGTEEWMGTGAREVEKERKWYNGQGWGGAHLVRGGEGGECPAQGGGQ